MAPVAQKTIEGRLIFKAGVAIWDVDLEVFVAATSFTLVVIVEGCLVEFGF